MIESVREDSPRVSIIVPCYNSEAYLASCLTSILSQERSDIEIVLIDDGSVDSTFAIAKAMLADYGSKCLIRIRNSGVSVARNVGLLHATGDYVLFVDSDDLLPEGALDHLLRIVADKRWEMVFGQYEVFDDNRPVSPVRSAELHGLTDRQIDADAMIRELLRPRGRGISGLCSRIMFRSDFIKANCIRFREGVTMAEDYCFVFDCLCSRPEVYFTDRVVYSLRRGHVSSTSKYMPSLREGVDFVDSHVLEYVRRRPELFPGYHMSVSNAAWLVARNFRRMQPSSLQERAKLISDAVVAYRYSIARTPLFSSDLPLVVSSLLKLSLLSPRLFGLILAVL